MISASDPKMSTAATETTPSRSPLATPQGVAGKEQESGGGWSTPGAASQPCWSRCFISTTSSPPTRSSWPGFLDWFLRLTETRAFQIFFVLSGVVVTHNVLMAGQLKGGFVARFALRRSLRLDPPYWVIIFLNLASAVAIHSTMYEGVGPLTVVANMFYLDNLLGVRSIVPVGWTLLSRGAVLPGAGDAAVWLGQWGLKRVPVASTGFLCLVPIWLWSVLIAAGLLESPWHGLFLGHWYLVFFMGATIAIFIRDRSRGRSALWVALSMEAHWSPVALLQQTCRTCSQPALRHRLSWRPNAGGWAGRQGAGCFSTSEKISYSLYLVHPLVGNRGASVPAAKRGSPSAPQLGRAMGALGGRRARQCRLLQIFSAGGSRDRRRGSLGLLQWPNAWRVGVTG